MDENKFEEEKIEQAQDIIGCLYHEASKQLDISRFEYMDLAMSRLNAQIIANAIDRLTKAIEKKGDAIGQDLNEVEDSLERIFDQVRS